jgi:hypothetical protein
MMKFLDPPLVAKCYTLCEELNYYETFFPITKSLFGIAVENRAFGYRAFVYKLLSKVLLLKSHYMFGNCMF